MKTQPRKDDGYFKNMAFDMIFSFLYALVVFVLAFSFILTIMEGR